MKMPPELYASLRDDIIAHAEVTPSLLARPLGPETPMVTLWILFHRVMRDRQFDDTHPAFAGGHWTRVLPYSDRFWLDRFYKDADLNDDQIATALRKIARDTPKGA